MKYKILWVDDEVDLLKPHILFLENKGYEIVPVISGADALEEIDNSSYDAVFLDENMPGMTGLETLNYIKSTHPNLPVIMITKSEEEQIMEEAIGSKIADYLIKPLNPNQILLSVKKILDNKRIISEKTNLGYQQEFRNLSMELNEVNNFADWIELYKRLVYWELEIDNTEDKSMEEILSMQKTEANSNFCSYVIKEYESWLNDPDIERPILSHQVLRKWVKPAINVDRPVFLIVIDNLRLDQWETMETEISQLFEVQDKKCYFSILPTTTAYARNAFFAGMMPSDIAKHHNDLWVGEESDKGKNSNEDKLLGRFLNKESLDIRYSYNKIIQASDGKNLVDQVGNLFANPLNAIVFNFVDMLSHARTDSQMIRQLAPDESAYRSLTLSWFTHSSLYDLLKKLSTENVKIMITTDHGTIRVKRPEKIIGDKNTNSNLRYKAGRNLAFNEREVFAVRAPERLKLPKQNFSTSFAFAAEDHFFAYPNNFNHYAKFYKDTFQHGGISMEEMIIPFITLNSKS